MAKSVDIDRKILAAAIHLIGAHPWPEISLATIAREAGLPIATVYRSYPSRLAVLCAIHRHIDMTMLDGAETEGAPRDLLFDLLMRRFDALAPLKPAFKTGLAELRRGRIGTLEALVTGALNLPATMAVMLDVVGLSGSFLVTPLRAKILAAVYLSAFRIWLEDDSQDLARTMAALDKALARAAPLLGLSAAQPRAAGSDDLYSGTTPA